MNHETGETVDKNLWLYELCRFLTMKANSLIIAFFADSPPCSSLTCPEMRASEWQYLCAVHEPPKSCCAIDYCCHTLDWATNILTSPKHFPSRLTLGGESGNVVQSMRQLTNVFRRVYRIFAHAWFQHRDVFWSVEASDGLYIFFKTVCDVYQLIPEDNYTIPPEAEAPRDEDEMPAKMASPDLGDNVQILKKPIEEQRQTKGSAHDTTANVNVAGATTRRHKQTPSTGTNVSTIAEGTEEEDEDEDDSDEDDSDEDEEDDDDMEKPHEEAPTEADLAAGLGRLKLNERVSGFDIRQPEDPTPMARMDVDPMELAAPEPEHQRGVLDQILGHMEDLAPEQTRAEIQSDKRDIIGGAVNPEIAGVERTNTERVDETAAQKIQQEEKEIAEAIVPKPNETANATAEVADQMKAENIKTGKAEMQEQAAKAESETELNVEQEGEDSSTDLKSPDL